MPNTKAVPYAIAHPICRAAGERLPRLSRLSIASVSLRGPRGHYSKLLVLDFQAFRRGAPMTFPLVAIGASAGGLEAVSELLSALPATGEVAFVLIQHLDPDH